MGGGVCAEQMQLMRDRGICEIVRDGPAMVPGVSAGSMNMGKTTVDIRESLVPYEGLGFADITMIGQLSYNDTERLRLMKAVSMERPVCAGGKVTRYSIKKPGNTMCMISGSDSPENPEREPGRIWNARRKCSNSNTSTGRTA